MAGNASDTASSAAVSSSLSNPYASSRGGSSVYSGPAAFAARFNRHDPFERRNDTFRYANVQRDNRGAWTTQDPETGKRRYDEVAQEARSTAASGASTPRGVSAADANEMDPSDPRNSSAVGVFGPNARMYSENEALDERFENPNLDIDPAVRRNFASAQEVLRGVQPARTLAEQRNTSLLPPTTFDLVQNRLNDRVVSSVSSAADPRLQYLDRDNNYIDGQNRGAISKRLRRGRKDVLDEFESEMVSFVLQERADVFVVQASLTNM